MIPGRESGSRKLSCNFGVGAGDGFAEQAAFLRGRGASAHLDENSVKFHRGHQRAGQLACALNARVQGIAGNWGQSFFIVYSQSEPIAGTAPFGSVLPWCHIVRIAGVSHFLLYSEYETGSDSDSGSKISDNSCAIRSSKRLINVRQVADHHPRGRGFGLRQ